MIGRRGFGLGLVVPRLVILVVVVVVVVVVVADGAIEVVDKAGSSCATPTINRTLSMR